jgi:hypothetical protein
MKFTGLLNPGTRTARCGGKTNSPQSSQRPQRKNLFILKKLRALCALCCKKPILVILFLILLTGNFSWSDLHDCYKKGRIVLKGAPDFGKNNDWEGLFYDPYKEIIAAPDGSIFVVNNRQHNFYKFDSQGNLVKTFGRKGQGPGDVIGPGHPSILDNKYLVVGEYGFNKKITIWDFSGKCLKVVRTKKLPSNEMALKDKKIAYSTFTQHAQKKSGYQEKILVIIKNIDKGTEKNLREITLLDRSSIDVKPGISTGVGNFFGEVYLAQTINGNLLVGISNQPKIDIYSPEGDLVFSFDLKIKPIPVDEKYINKFRDKVLADIKKEGEKSMDDTHRFYHNLSKKFFPTFDFSTIFEKHLPLYKEILVDSEGNFLVFIYNDCVENCKTFFQVYSPKGEFICETELDGGKYDLKIDRRWKRLCFTQDGIIGYFMKKGDEDEIYRLVKSRY